MQVGDLVQMPRMKKLGKTLGVVIEIEDKSDHFVRVCWGEYGTFWTMRKLLKKFTKEEHIKEQSSIQSVQNGYEFLWECIKCGWLKWSQHAIRKCAACGGKTKDIPRASRRDQPPEK